MKVLDIVLGKRKRRSHIILTDDVSDLPLEAVGTDSLSKMMFDRLSHGDLLIAASRLQQDFNNAVADIERLTLENLKLSETEIVPLDEQNNVTERANPSAISPTATAKLAADYDASVQSIRTSYRRALEEKTREVESLKTQLRELRSQVK